MTHEQIDNLKPCPLCGAPPEIRHTPGPTPDLDLWEVECDGMDHSVRLEASSKEDGIKYWNGKRY